MSSSLLTMRNITNLSGVWVELALVRIFGVRIGVLTIVLGLGISSWVLVEHSLVGILAILTTGAEMSLGLCHFICV